MVTRLISFVVCTLLIFSVAVSKEASKKGTPKHVHVGARVVPVAPLTGDEPGSPSTGISYPSTYALGPGDSIGFTRYDFGTNGSPNTNLINYDEVTISYARMAAQQPGPTWPDRGSWIACTTDGGATWPPLTKAESIRTGWTNIAQIADANGTGTIVSHDAVAVQFHNYVDADRCANVWSGGTTGIGGIWPRIGVGNGFGLHVLHADIQLLTNVLYSHSPDAGSTWDVQAQPMFTSPGFVATADGWNVATQGDNVALVSAGTGGDVIVVSSTDGGSTWSEQVVYDVDNTLLTPQDVPDASCSAIYDLTGNLHVVWGSWYALGDGALYYSIDAGIYHWSEATGVQEIALPTQDTSITVPVGTMGASPGPATNGDLASCPDIGVDDDNNLYVIYQNYITEKDVNVNHYQHPYGLGSSDGGATWTTPIDLTPGFGFDASFPTMADHVGQYLHISYLCDPFAGNALRGVHTEVDVAIMYLQIDKTLILPTPVSDEFFDDFDAYTAGTQLVAQNNTDWDTWSSLPGSGEDPFVSNAHSYSGSNTVVIAQSNDLVRLHDERTTGTWGISFQVYIPSGKAGYFNTLSGFRQVNPDYWAMECYFDSSGAGRLLTGDPQVNFTWTPDTWQLVEVIVDLDQDMAQFVFNGAVLHQWQWTNGTSVGTGPLELDANDFYGATAYDEMYVDDYHFVADSLRTTGVHEPGAVTPREFALEQNYPNPFNPATTISYQLPASSHVVLRVFDLLGQEVKTLVEQDQAAGYYTARWDGKNNAGASVGSGVYFFRINAKGDSEKEYASFKRMLLLK